MKDSGVVLLYMTVPNRELGVKIAGDLVERGLAACGNLIEGMTSIYSWQGRVHRDPECLLVVKTLAGRVDDAVEAVTVMHTYDLPAVLVIPVIGGHGEFLDWVRACCHT